MTAALEGGEWSAARPGRTLPPGKTRYPFYRRLGGPQGRSGRAENLVPTGIRSQTVQPVAQSLYRLSYQAHALYSTWLKLQDGSIVSVNMDVVGVMAAYCDSLCVWVCVYVVQCIWRYSSAFLYSELRTHTHNGSEYAAITPILSMSTDTIEPSCNFSQVLYKAPLWWILCDPNHVGALLNML